MRTWCGDSETQAVLRRDQGEKANGRRIEILNNISTSVFLNFVEVTGFDMF